MDHDSILHKLERGERFLRELQEKTKYSRIEDDPKRFWEENLRNLSDPDFIIIHPFDRNKIQAAAYELSLGDQAYATADELPIDFRLENKARYLRIEPGEFAVLTTREYVYVPPDLVGFISIRYGYKERGLVNVSGFHVDPGFFGKLLFTVYNAGPSDIVLPSDGETIFMIMFAELKRRTSKPYESKRQGQREIPADVVAHLRGTSVSPRNLDERVRRLEMWILTLTGTVIPIIISIFVGVILGILR